MKLSRKQEKSWGISNCELSLNDFQKLAKPSKIGICELVCLVVPLTIPEEFSVLLAEDGSSMCIPSYTTRWLAEIQSRKIVFCSIHLSLVSATLAPQKRKVNIFFKKVFVCILFKYSRKYKEFYEKVHHPAGQRPPFYRKSSLIHRDARLFCNLIAGW